ncbi:serine/threonine protein kinase [Iamia sp. SCSIO 61187]|uniref:serine/threonine-protein kinase n=1 Tax=Iamia sp. SCSIO 61187 TaxID=2722752 RepID=UPI001C62B027|nr:serine/threonine-protein kinase [Iamia sp. SCSIO 61187]QYG93860.1 serine/threonine protein kinase [Iamia sp. SCSIO 61187]
MQYQVVRRLGRGGMGVVDLAVAPDGTEVALKRLSLHGTPDEIARARARIRREAEVLRSLDHPGIVRLLDLLDDGDDVVLVMPYLSGGSLHQRVATQGPMEPEAVQVLADRLLDALAAAHRQGVVHRDIKPENVLFTADGDPRLVDFGVASTQDHTLGLTATSMVVGTPGFMAPEQARGEPASAAADVFALGATLLFALTGAGPFGPVAADPRVLMHRAASGKVDRPPRDLPPELRAVLVTALDPRADRRPSAARLRGSAATGATSPLTGLADVVLRNRVLVGGVAAVVALLLVAGLVAVVTGGDDGRAAGEALAPQATTTSTPLTTTTAPCTDLPYWPCTDGVRIGTPAPNTDGHVCDTGFADYDDEPQNGCEAEPDDLDDPELLTDDDGEVEGTIVPRDDVDTFVLPTEDGGFLCNGDVTVTLSAPEGMDLEVVVRRDVDGQVVAIEQVDGGDQVEVRVGERCLESDGDIGVVVRAVGEGRAAAAYTLARDGSF